jgi:anthranilate synthase component I
MKKIQIQTNCKKMLADVHTPVGIYLRLRDRFRDTVMLESTDSHVADNSWTFIGVQAIGGIEVKDLTAIEYKYPGQQPERKPITNKLSVAGEISNFLQQFEPNEDCAIKAAQSLFGYTSFDAVQFFDSIDLSSATKQPQPDFPLIRYRLYQYVIAINHFKDELYLCENKIAGVESEFAVVESLIRSKDVPVFPFKTKGTETSNMTDEDYIAMVKKGIASSLRGDVFQIVLSRRFQQSFTGDEFNVYRALRSINPSPYLFFFDYGDYKLMGSSPESQLIVKNGKAIVHPIAGTFKRTGDDAKDEALAEALLNDEKENAEHVMLVDLARNDLSRHATEVTVSSYRKVHYYSHVIHLVSEVTGKINAGVQPFEILADTFPAGTLSGAPKFKAMQLINQYEPTQRGYYGGCIGLVGLDGSFNQAIMIRTFLSRNNTLHYQAGAGVVAKSVPESELQEVNNKLNALKNAIALAEEIF